MEASNVEGHAMETWQLSHLINLERTRTKMSAGGTEPAVSYVERLPLAPSKQTPSKVGGGSSKERSKDGQIRNQGRMNLKKHID